MQLVKTAVGKLILSLICLIIVNSARAQKAPVDTALLNRVAALEQQAADQKPGESHFMVAGLATFGFVSTKTTLTGVNGIKQSLKKSGGCRPL